MNTMLGRVLAAAVLSTAVAMSALETDAAMNFKERPVMKVVRLLQDTKAELEKELEVRYKSEYCS
jgi:hypothetical protein